MGVVASFFDGSGQDVCRRCARPALGRAQQGRDYVASWLFQSTGTVLYLATSTGLTALERLPHDCRM